jgi:hypothetical protein
VQGLAEAKYVDFTLVFISHCLKPVKNHPATFDKFSQAKKPLSKCMILVANLNISTEH